MSEPRLPRHARTRTVRAVFVLADLTPATRELYRAFVAADAAMRHAATRMDRAHEAAAAARMPLWHAEQGTWSPTAEQRARAEQAIDAAYTDYELLLMHFERAADRCTTAFRAAKPAMQAEGYPSAWWVGGTMRVPAAATSCGCACSTGGFCGGCGHAGCGRR